MQHTCNYFFTAILLTFSSDSAIAVEVESKPPDSSMVSRVEIILTPERITTIRPLQEDDLPTWGCTFESSSKEKVEDLLSLINLNIEYASINYDYQLRNLIYLHLKDGGKVTYLLSDGYYKSELAVGNYTSSVNNQSSGISAPSSMLKSLRLWASDNVSRKNFSEFCIK